MRRQPICQIAEGEGELGPSAANLILDLRCRFAGRAAVASGHGTRSRTQASFSRSELSVRRMASDRASSRLLPK